MTQKTTIQHKKQAIDTINDGSSNDEQKQLMNLRETILAVTEDDDEEEEDENNVMETKKRLLADLDSLVTRKLVKGLEKKFSDIKFKVELEHVAPPSLGSTKSGYRFILRKLSWTNGPSPHQVFYYIRDKYRYYLNSDKFDESMFIKSISDMDKRYTSFFFPLPIGNKNISAIEIFPRQIIEGKKSYYSVDVIDNKLNIKNVKGDTLNQALSLLQIKLEGIYYREDGADNGGPKPYDTHKYFLKKYLNTEANTKE